MIDKWIKIEGENNTYYFRISSMGISYEDIYVDERIILYKIDFKHHTYLFFQEVKLIAIFYSYHSKILNIFKKRYKDLDFYIDISEIEEYLPKNHKDVIQWRRDEKLKLLLNENI